MNYKILLFAALSATSVSLFTAGCERTISQDKKTTVHDDGSTKTKEKTVTEEPDGSIKKTEETKQSPSSQ